MKAQEVRLLCRCPVCGKLADEQAMVKVGPMKTPAHGELFLDNGEHNDISLRLWEQNSAGRFDEPASSRRSMMKIFTALLAFGVVIGAAAPADAKGCIKGAIVGGVAGHMVGHGAAGAAAGCVIGHHEANKRQNTNQNR